VTTHSRPTLLLRFRVLSFAVQADADRVNPKQTIFDERLGWKNFRDPEVDSLAKKPFSDTEYFMMVAHRNLIGVMSD
jgi:hypothetical protein